MIQIKDQKNCCGCTACASICGHDAISMVPDEMGFVYPSVNLDKCTDCGLCERVCSFSKEYDKSQNLPSPIAYATRHINAEEVQNSRSGATFVTFSDYILEQGGVVYGAGFGEHFRVKHKRATTIAERNEFRGSKYVQSDLSGIFRQIKEDLKAGKLVLFSGTPCQTAGLNTYIGNKLRNNLFLIDIVCHGVPGPKVWDDYLNYIESKEESTLIDVNCRDKQQFGWKLHHETFRFAKDPTHKRFFNFTFYKSLLFRPSCNNCQFANYQRPSDITIADFWGWETVAPELNKDMQGVNLLLINTEKGKILFEQSKKNLLFKNVHLEDTKQKNLQQCTPPHANRDKFKELYIKDGFYIAMHKYGGLEQNIADRIKDKFKRLLRKISK